MDRPPPTRLLLVAGAVAVLGVLAVLVRPGTAVDEQAVSRAVASPAPASAPATPSLPVAGAGPLVVRADGVDGLRLGMAADEVVAAGFSVQPGSYGGCRRVLPGLADAGPGPGTAAWLVDGVVEVVTVDERAGNGPSFLGPGLGDPVDDWAALAGAEVVTLTTEVPWQAAPVAREVVLVVPSRGRRAAFADLTGDGVVDHVQLRTDRGARCGAAQGRLLEAQRTGLPPLTTEGWGELRVGTPLAEADALVGLQPGREDVATPLGRCRLVLADREPGLVYVVVGPDPARPDAGPVVRSVAVDAGRTGTGLAVGAPADRVQDAYPGVTSAFLEDRWDQGLVAEWQLPDGVLRLAPTREQVRVDEVDGVLRGPRNVVGMVQLGQGC
ncbi:hypothetical protein [Jannaschia sp. R86511]|uniref:hypothetical protein n=1 Tax=Jannaschia sp. R86511 TaxID=3093853 RepID=UPI0036D2FC2E